jgi:ubiquinone/menaquinone biosynthesis C-methylase UbiE
MGSRVKAFYDEDSMVYEKKRFQKGGRWVHQTEINLALTFLKLQKNDLILDVGVGTGRLEEVISHQGYRTVSCDLSIEMLKQVKPSQLTSLICMDAQNLPYRTSIFQKCVAMRFIFHFDEQEKFVIISEMNRVLNSEGLMVFDLQSSRGPLSFLLKLRRGYLNYPISPQRVTKLLQRLSENNYTLKFCFVLPRGFYRYLPQKLAKWLVRFDFNLPELLRRWIGSTIFCLVGSIENRNDNNT